MTIHISSMMPDRSLDESELIQAIVKIAMLLAKAKKEQIPKTPSLDIIFLLPSQQEKAGFTGLRLTSFDKASQTLTLESAVPEKMVTSAHAQRFVIAVILDAIDAAKEFFNEQKIPFNETQYSALIEFIDPTHQPSVH